MVKSSDNIFLKVKIKELHSFFENDDEDGDEDNAIPDRPKIMEYHNGKVQ